jgi:PAS domain S-box-containing protein
VRQGNVNNAADLSEECLALLDALPDFLVLLSPDLKIQWVNQHVALALGESMAELTEQYCWHFWDGERRRCDDCPAARTLRTGKPERVRLSRPDGRIWDVRTFTLRDTHGQVRNIVEMCRDVTEQVTMQAEARRMAHLASLGELAAGVMHEVNNAINGIINYAQILGENVKMREEDARIAGRILKEGHRLATIAANFLSFAQAQRTEKTLLHLCDLLADSLALTGRQFAKDHIIVNVHMATGLPQIFANAPQIAQVFLNILHNARYALNSKYAGAAAGKILDILGEHVTVEGRPYLRVTFHDHGVGIPASLLEYVMEPFFSTKPRGLGTGLGLSISHSIVVEHDGSLIVESVEREFTKVHVLLPGRV